MGYSILFRCEGWYRYFDWHAVASGQPASDHSSTNQSHKSRIVTFNESTRSALFSWWECRQSDRCIDSSSQRAEIDLEFEKAAAIDLAGRDVFEAVQVSVNPKVIETPKVSAVAQNGIELIVKAKVTVRANIERLVGGAGEDTIIARVGEGIVTTVGSSEKHEEVLENPDSMSQTVLKKGLDSGTAFEILSIDIADVDVVVILVRNYKRINLKPIRTSRKQKLKNVVPWQLLKNKKCVQKWYKLNPKFH